MLHIGVHLLFVGINGQQSMLEGVERHHVAESLSVVFKEWLTREQQFCVDVIVLDSHCAQIH